MALQCAVLLFFSPSFTETTYVMDGAVDLSDPAAVYTLADTTECRRYSLVAHTIKGRQHYTDATGVSWHLTSQTWALIQYKDVILPV